MSAAQKRDVETCRADIEWLVRDEIAAAVRSAGPVTEQTLNMVVDHVKSSQDKAPCRHAKEPLTYVLSPETSHQMFLAVRSLIALTLLILRFVELSN